MPGTQETFIQALDNNPTLSKYGEARFLLFALGLRYPIGDFDTVAADALTGRGDDKKCDMVYFDEDAQVAVIAQGYISEKLDRPCAPSNKASDLNTAAAWLLGTPTDDLPETIAYAASQLRESITSGSVRSIEFWYVHNLPESVNVRQELARVKTTADSYLRSHYHTAELEVSAQEVGRETLQEWYSSLETPILVTDDFALDVPSGYELHGDNWDAYVTAVPASWLFNVYNKHGKDLFSANIRGYLGSRRSDNNINNGIKKSASEEPGHFWVYNNGLTILVNNYAPPKGRRRRLSISGMSIVNGAQTTGAIGSLSKSPADTARVPVRFIKCANRNIVQDIIAFNNSQNKVETPDLRSNDMIQQRLREQFQSIPNATYLGGRRGGDEDVIRRTSDLLPSDTVGQALAAFHQKPWVAYHQKSQIWSSDTLYSQFFSPATTARHIVFAYSLMKAVEYQKRELLTKSEDGLTQTQGPALGVLRRRGATFLMTAAIARCLETFLGRAVPDIFSVHFKDNVSPEQARILWQPIVDAICVFAERLEPAATGGIRQNEALQEALKDFSSLVDATKTANEQMYGEFACDVAVSS